MKLKFLILLIALINIKCNTDKKPQTLIDKKVEINKVANDFIVKPSLTEVSVEDSSEIDRDELVNFAKKFIGVPYVYATQDPEKGFDCSGFVNYVYKNFDIIVPRSSSGFKKFGKKIHLEEEN